jgi:hypothetical protein
MSDNVIPFRRRGVIHCPDCNQVVIAGPGDLELVRTFRGVDTDATDAEIQRQFNEAGVSPHNMVGVCPDCDVFIEYRLRRL